MRTYSDSEEDRWFSCCAFSVSDNATEAHTHSAGSRVFSKTSNILEFDLSVPVPSNVLEYSWNELSLTLFIPGTWQVNISMLPEHLGENRCYKK